MIPARFKKLFVVAQELYGNFRAKFVVLGALGFANGLLGALGVGALIPLFSFLIKKDTADRNTITHLMEWLLTHLHLESNIPSVLLLVTAFFLLKAVALFLFKYLGVRIVARFEAETRAELYKQALSASWPYLLHQKIGHMENIIMSDVHGALNLLSIGLSLLNTATSTLMYTAVALTINPFVTGIVLGGGTLLLFLTKPLRLKRRRYGKGHSVIQKAIAHEVNQNALGMKVIKAMGADERAHKAATSFFYRLAEIKIRMGMLKAIFSAFLQPFTIAAISIFFWFVYEDPHFDIASFIAVIYLIQQIFLLVDKTQDGLGDLQSNIPYASNILTFRDSIRKHKELPGGNLPFIFSRELSFVHVGFSYGEDQVLDDVSFIVKRGMIFGVMGPSGSGKTTIADLMLRLFEPQQGAIFLDGVDCRHIARVSWRKKIGYVPQDIFLRNDTIANNIRFYDDAVTQEEMERATQIAQILDTIQALPHGFETVVGERGILLSVGQRQRIALARALARKSELIILDEATSALDNESEQMFKKAIEALRNHLTLIVIAHRPSTILSCDRMIVLENARIIEEGEPQKLLVNPESYLAQMVKLGSGTRE